MRRRLLAKLRPLRDAEFMLLVNNHQTEIPKFNISLQQRDGPDNNVHLARTDCLQNLRSLSAGQSTRDHHPFDVAVLQVSLDTEEMLAGQNLRRRHDRHLHLIGDRQQCGVQRDHGFTRAHVALQQSIHRLRFTHIGNDFRDTRILIGGEQKRKPLSNPAFDFVGVHAWDRRGKMLDLVPAKRQSQLHQEQLVVFQPAFGLRQLLFIRRQMNPGKRLSPRYELRLFQKTLIVKFRDKLIHRVTHVADDLPDLSARQSFTCRINSASKIFGRRRMFLVEDQEFRIG